MNIQQLSRTGGTALVAVILASTLAFGFGVNAIRFGGDMHLGNQQLHEFNADILPPPSYLVEAYLVAHLVVRSPGRLDAHAAKLDRLKRDFRKRANHWAASDLDPRLKAGLATTAAEDGEAFWALIDNRLIPAARAGDAGAQADALARLDAVYDRHRARIDSLVQGAAREQASLDEGADATVAAVLVGLSLSALAVLAAIVAALVLLRRRVIEPLAATAETMERMAAGDLEAGRCTNDKDDEIGTMTRAIEVFRKSVITAQESDSERKRVVAVLRERLSAMASGDLDAPIVEFLPVGYKGIRMDFNQAQAALRDLILSVVHSAQEIHHSAGDVNDAASALSERAARQAATLQATAAALQRTNQGIQSSATLAQEANAEVALARGNATRNGEIVETAVTAMAQIQASFAEVENITNIIQNIAFQTNILALNAGVEATRAGEAGKGFGVVATEVRALAQRSSEAVTAIQQLLGKSAETITNGTDQVSSSGVALREMIEIIDRVSQRVEELAASSRDQAANLNEVDGALSKLDYDTQQNAVMAEQSRAASEALKQEVGQLTARTALFRRASLEKTGAPAVDLRLYG